MPKINEIVFIYEGSRPRRSGEFVLTYNEQLIDSQLAGAKGRRRRFRHGIAPSRPAWAEERKMGHTGVQGSAPIGHHVGARMIKSPPGSSSPTTPPLPPAALPQLLSLTIKRAPPQPAAEPWRAWGSNLPGF